MGTRNRSYLLAAAVAATLWAAAAAQAAPQAGAWQTWWGQVTQAQGVFTLASQVPVSPGETHSALVTSRRTWGDQTFSYTLTTLAQLRTGSAPNTWEVGWSMFRFRDLHHYYWFILRPNGWELGKKQGSDTQIFLATGTAPSLVAGQTNRIRINVQGARVQVSVDGTTVVDYTDAHPLAPGSVALYEEDSLVRFESVSVVGA